MKELRRKLRNYLWRLLTPSLAVHLGDFTTEQLQLAGLQVPERNQDRQGGRNINPGTDSETEELRRRSEEDADLLGRDDNSEEGSENSSEAQQQPRPNHAAAVARATAVGAARRTTSEMSYSKMLSVIPGFDEGAVTKTMYLMSFVAPGGVRTATASLMPTCGGAKWVYDEIPEGFNADFLMQEVAGVRGNFHMLAHLRNDLEAFINGNENLARVHDGITGSTSFTFPERAEPFLFNPHTRDRDQPVYSRIATGGRTVFMSACWQLRNEPIHRPLAAQTLTEQEQLAQAARYFPGIANRLNNMFGPVPPAPPAPQPGPPPPPAPPANGNGIAAGAPLDAALMQNLVQRMQAQEQQLQQQQQQMQQQQQQAVQQAEQQRRRFEETTNAVRRQYEGALDRYRNQMQQQVTQATARVVGGLQNLTEAEVRAMSHDEFQRRLDSAIAELTTGPPPAPGAAGRGGPEVVTVGGGDTSSDDDSTSRMSALSISGAV